MCTSGIRHLAAIRERALRLPRRAERPQRLDRGRPGPAGEREDVRHYGMYTRTAALSLALIGCSVLGGCRRAATGLLVVVDTDYRVPGDLDRIHVAVEGAAGSNETSADYPLLDCGGPNVG